MTADNGMGVSPSWQELKDERDYLEHCYHLLASEMVYEGNSVQHWQQKAMAYKECAGAVYDLKQLVDAGTPAEVVEAVQALAAQLEKIRPIAQYGLRAARSRNNPASLEWTNILADTPATSLARLKAEAEQAFADWAEHDLTQDGLFINFEKLLERYRRQAEGRHP